MESRRQLWNVQAKTKTLKTCNLFKIFVSNTKVRKKINFNKMRKKIKVCKLSVIQILTRIHTIKEILSKVLKQPQWKNRRLFSRKFLVLLPKVARQLKWRTILFKSNKVWPQPNLFKKNRHLKHFTWQTINHQLLSTKVILRWKRT